MASATHFCPSRSTPRPGTASETACTSARPGPVAVNAGSSTAAPASTSSGSAGRLRSAAGRPSATTASSAAVATTAKSVVRESGTACAFQIPPRPARLPTVANPGSARAANAAVPAPPA